MDDSELLGEFVEEAREHLGDVEMQLLQIEALGADIDDNLVNTVFRAIHSVKGAAGFLGLVQINDVAHRLENVLGRVRDHKLVPDPYNVDVMLKAADRLRRLTESVSTSNQTDNSELIARLDQILADQAAPAAKAVAVEVESTNEAKSPKKRSRAAKPKAHAAESETPKPKAASTRGSSKQTPVGADRDEPADRVEETLSEIESNLEEERGLNAHAEPTQETQKTAKRISKGDSSDASGAESNRTATPGSEATIRVGVRVLDRLMNLAGELVLSRNQLLRVLSERTGRSNNLDTIVSGLDQVTTELQETIMQTRMQPIGNVFNKFPRVIRDLSATLGKQINLRMEGNEVEVDKTIVEAMADPLTHLIRNSCDHGIESPEARQLAGKNPVGNVVLRAFHQAGKVMIEITDDGAGMDPKRLRAKAVEKGLLSPNAAEQLSDRDAVNLIFAPGFSTAPAITAVSGRGVGMDVVRTNIEKLGGSVEVTSTHGQGSMISITLPLTLAIVPSMIIAVGDRRYALPQANIAELVRTDGHDKRIEKVSSTEVLRLRGTLIPLVRLRETLGMEPLAIEEANPVESQLVVVEAGRSRFALAVDRVLDSEEIVVKPLGRTLNNLPLLAGATILGDGRVAMILDAAGIAGRVKLSSEAEAAQQNANASSEDEANDDLQRLVLLSVGPKDHFAVSMDIVSRIERVSIDAIEQVGDRRVVKYRGGTLQLLAVDDVVPVVQTDETSSVYVIVFKVYGHEVGLIAPYLNDIRDCAILGSMETCRQPGVAGIAVIDDRSTRLLDLYGLCEIARPEWFEGRKAAVTEDREVRLLVCEDSAFFRNFLTKMLVDEGFKVTACENGEEGWSALAESPNFDMVITDVEMPELDGLGLTRRIRADGRFPHLPIIALTSLADNDSIQRGLQAGVTEYQVKMNKPELLAGIARLTAEKRK